MCTVRPFQVYEGRGTLTLPADPSVTLCVCVHTCEHRKEVCGNPLEFHDSSQTCRINSNYPQIYWCNVSILVVVTILHLTPPHLALPLSHQKLLACEFTITVTALLYSKCHRNSMFGNLNDNLNIRQTTVRLSTTVNRYILKHNTTL